MQPRLLKHPARLAGASLLRLQDDARLVALAREGHDPAFAAIVDRYGRQLERYCARLLGPGRAEDAVQQAFVNAHAAMRASEQELALKPWLYRIAHNAALNILRASREEDDALDLDRPGATQTPEVVELRERLRETFAAIQALPAAQRDALLLRELEGRSHEEIALALGVSEGGARQHLHRARVAVRAAASAVTPYPVLARVLSAAAAEGGRSSDLVSGAGLGAGAGAMKVAAGVLAAGAIAGGAVGVHQHRSTPAHARSAAAGHSRSTTAPSEANGPSATPLEVADITSAGATASHGRGRDQGGARGHDRGRRHEHGGGREQHGSFVSGDHSGTHGSDGGHSGSSGGEHIASKDDSSKSGSGSSGSGSHDSGSGAGSGSDDTTTEASHEEPTTTTSDGGSSGGGSGDSLSSEPSGSSGSDDGGSSTTSTTSTEGSGSSGSSGSSDRTTTTSDH
jgi:RNA polymerase sigma factor (sigma-70 family)